MLTDFYVGDSRCTCEPQCANWHAIEKTPELKRRKGEVQHRAMMVIMANLAKQWFSSSLTSTSSLTASLTATVPVSQEYEILTDSLAEIGISRGDSQNLRTIGYDLFGRSGKPPFSKGIPDSNSNMMKDANRDDSKDSLVQAVVAEACVRQDQH